MTEYTFDNHTLRVICDCATQEQIIIAMKQAMTKYQQASGIKLDPRFRVNLVTNKDDKSFGFAYVYVQDSRVYHMLLGKNPDGSERVEYVDDETWRPPEDGELTNQTGWSFTDEDDFSMDYSQPIKWGNDDSHHDWGVVVDEYDSFIQAKQTQDKKFICPQIPRELPPLMTLPTFNLTKEQMESRRDNIITKNEGKEDFDPELVDVPEEAHFTVDRAGVLEVEAKYMHNIIKAVTVPEWITPDDLKIQFAPYASDSTTRHERSIKGHKYNDTYPFTSISADRVCFVIFDPATTDAQFALHMMKKTIIKKTVNGKEMSHTLIFFHSYKTDRDMMTSITKKKGPYKNGPRKQPSGGKPRREQSRSPRNIPPASPVKRAASAPIIRGNPYDALSSD